MLHMEHPTETEQVAKRVVELIEDAGVTQVWLCDETGIPRTTMHRRLSGQSAFNINELSVIAKALRVPTADFFASLPVSA